MINGRVVIYVLIISYLLHLGHNLIPHHHHHEGQKNSTLLHHHHLPIEDEDTNDHNVILLIFGNILHHDDEGLIVMSSSEHEKPINSSGNVFGLLNKISVFENMLWTIKSKHPPDDKSYHKLQIHYYNGLRAPPVA